MSKSFVDFGDVFKKLNAIEKNFDKIAVDAINEAALVAAEELKNKTPEWYGKGGSNHAKDHITTTKATKNNLNAEVGYDKEVAWRMHFVEFGTINQRPQGFVQKTIEDMQDEIQEIIIRKLQEALQ
jgi:HK97 gp10 family phage protein